MDTPEHQALERFVTDNDDLLRLEELIGRFNIFDALGIARREIQHSNFLAWLIDPAESHGQGDLFLKAIVLDLLKQAGPSKRALSPIELDGVELHDVEIRREWRKIDLLITSRDPDFVLAIENKVDSGEHSNQLQRYEDVVKSEWPQRRRMFVFLTVDGEEASDEDWVSYSYEDLHEVLSRVRRTNATSIGHDVLTFLDHYLNLLGIHFMNTEIEELCRRIYKNHRQAIDLIHENAGTQAASLTSRLEDMLKESDSPWQVNRTGTTLIYFEPKTWKKIKSPSEHGVPSKPFFRILVRPRKAIIHVALGPSEDASLRKAMIEHLVREDNPFGFKTSRREITDQWTIIHTKTVFTWPEPYEPPEDEVTKAVKAHIEALLPRLVSVPDEIAAFLAAR